MDVFQKYCDGTNHFQFRSHLLGLITFFLLEVSSWGAKYNTHPVLEYAPAILKMALVRPPPGFEVLCFLTISPLQDSVSRTPW